MRLLVRFTILLRLSLLIAGLLSYWPQHALRAGGPGFPGPESKNSSNGTGLEGHARIQLNDAAS